MKFVPEVCLGATGLVGLDAPCGIWIEGWVASAFAFGPGPGAGAVDGVPTWVVEPDRHGCCQHLVEQVLQGSLSVSALCCIDNGSSVRRGSSFAWMAIRRRRTWWMLMTAPV
ncbi:MAG: hypothetical protein WKF82_06040 [Nocardioidaceae bacterium]